jgi:hypothetical protein
MGSQEKITFNFCRTSQKIYALCILLIGTQKMNPVTVTVTVTCTVTVTVTRITFLLFFSKNLYTTEHHNNKFELPNNPPHATFSLSGT